MTFDISKITLPTNPGIYLMKDSSRKIIYIGKAKNLKNRVKSYFLKNQNYKTQKLVKNISDIEFVLTDNESEAFLLESNMIKKYRPKFNIELKDQLASLNKKVKDLNEKIKELPPPPEEQIEELIKLQSPISLKQTFIQNTWNAATNHGNVPTQIYDPDNLSSPIVTIPPGTERKFDLQNQTEVIIKFGTQEERVKVGPNLPPEINIAPGSPPPNRTPFLEIHRSPINPKSKTCTERHKVQLERRAYRAKSRCRSIQNSESKVGAARSR